MASTIFCDGFCLPVRPPPATLTIYKCNARRLCFMHFSRSYFRAKRNKVEILVMPLYDPLSLTRINFILVYIHIFIDSYDFDPRRPVRSTDSADKRNISQSHFIIPTYLPISIFCPPVLDFLHITLFTCGFFTATFFNLG